MFGKKHSETTKQNISEKLIKHSGGAGIHDLDGNLKKKIKK